MYALQNTDSSKIEAISSLAAAKEHDVDMTALADDPDFAALKDDPRFKKLVGKD